MWERVCVRELGCVQERTSVCQLGADVCVTTSSTALCVVWECGGAFTFQGDGKLVRRAQLSQFLES